MSKLVIVKILGYISTLALMSITAKVLTISDFAYLNLFLQWLVPLTIIQTLGLPLLSNVYVGGQKMSSRQYIQLSKKITQKVLITTLPIALFISIVILNMDSSLIISYVILLIGNIILYFQSQLLQAKKLFYESFLVSNYGQRGVFLSSISCLIIGIFILIEKQLNISNIFLIIFSSILVTIIYSSRILKKSISFNVKSVSVTEKELAFEGLKISLNSILHNLTFPLIFLIGIFYLTENIIAKYQTNLKLIFLLLHFYQGILLSVLIPDIYALFQKDQNILLSKVKKIMLNTLILGSLMIILFYFFHAPFLTIIFSSEFLMGNGELISLSLILLVGVIFDTGFTLLTYCKFNREALLIRFIGILIGVFISFIVYLNNSNFFSINFLLFIFYLLPNTLAFFYWLKMIRN